MSMNAMNFTASKASVKRYEAIAAETGAEAREYCHGAASGLQAVQGEVFDFCIELRSPDGLKTYKVFNTLSEGMEAFKEVFLDEGELDIEYVSLESGRFSWDGSAAEDYTVSTGVIWRGVDEWEGGTYCQEGTYRDPQPQVNLTGWEFTAE